MQTPQRYKGTTYNTAFPTTGNREISDLPRKNVILTPDGIPIMPSGFLPGLFINLNIYRMNRLKMMMLAFLSAGIALPSHSQQPVPPVPVDPDIRIGKLENGLTYYIRHNEEPKERASFYIIQNVGAILEEDNQNGLAHFLEHMAFNGTLHFPGKGIINTLEKHGVAFGRNINAYTSTDQTVYNLSDVPVTHPGLIDTCLLVLHDWSDFLLLTDEEIDLERGVISEEWRTRRNANFRMQKKIYPVLFRDSKYAERDVIGDLEVIKNFKPETLRKFYEDWYRTDLQAIAVVGDINVDEVEGKIKALFGAIPAEVNPPARLYAEIPPHKETLFALATDPEATQYGISLYIKHPGTAPDDKNLMYYRDQIGNLLFNSIMRDRIAELLQKGQPPFVAGNISYGRLTGKYNVMAIAGSAHPGRTGEALRSIYTEALRVKRHGITPSELDRAKSNLLTRTETRWKQKDKIENDQYLDDIVNHFLTNEPLTSIDFDWEALQQLLPTISAEELSAKANQWIADENRVIIVMGPEGDEVKLINEQEALAILKEVEAAEIEPYAEEEVASTLIEKELKGSPVVATRTLPGMNATEWTLGNNAKVVYRFAGFQKDNVLLRAVSPGGSSLYPPAMLASAMMLSDFTGNFGVGSFDAITLKKMLTGKNVTLNQGITELYESFTGNSTPKDFETLLQLLYLQFEEPRFDKEAYDALSSRYLAMVTNLAKNPQQIMSDSLQKILSGYSPRTKLLTPALFGEMSLEQMEKIYRDRFADAGDFTFFIVGNIDEATVKPMIEKYIGSLTDSPRTEQWIDNKVGMPDGKTVKEIPIPLETEKATVSVVFNSEIPWNPNTNMAMNVVRDVLRLRYTEEIREKEGGTYGVRVAAQNEKYPRNEKTLQMGFDTDPAKAAHLKSILYREAEKLAQKGPTPEDLDKVVKNILKDREQAKPNNNYWMMVLSEYYRNGVNLDLASNYEDILQNMTAREVRKFAKKFFAKADVADVVFKPLKAEADGAVPAK